MFGSGSVQHDVYTARDIAQAAGVPETRVLQLVARGEIRSIAAQLPIEEKVRRADHVINTDGSFEETNRQVRSVYEVLVGG